MQIPIIIYAILNERERFLFIAGLALRFGYGAISSLIASVPELQSLPYVGE